MKNRKAPDELSLVAEHLRNGGPIVCYILEKLFNKIYEEGHIPDAFKCGIITPVYKKHGKPIDDPNSYRRITVCSVIGKIFEKLVQAKIIDKLDSKQSKLQRGLLKAYHLQMLVYYLLKPSLSPWMTIFHYILFLSILPKYSMVYGMRLYSVAFTKQVFRVRTGKLLTSGIRT